MAVTDYRTQRDIPNQGVGCTKGAKYDFFFLSLRDKKDLQTSPHDMLAELRKRTRPKV